MNDVVEVHFCHYCSHDTQSIHLTKFWKKIVICYIALEVGYVIDAENLVLEKFSKKLERLGYIVSTDIKHDLVLVPNGIYELDSNQYFVCLSPKTHGSRAN